MVVDDLVLLDPSDLRREVVGGLSERILRARGWSGTFSTTADPHAALGGGRLRRRPAAHRRPGGAPRRRDAAGRVRVPGPGDDRRRRAGQGAAHRADRARAGRGDGGPFQPRGLAGRLHQSGRDRDAGAAGRGPSRRGAVQRGHLGPATDRALSRRRSRCRRRRARGAEPPDVDQVGPGRRSSGVRSGDRPPRRPVRALRSRARARERHPDRPAAPAARAAVVLRALLLPARRRSGAAVGAGVPVPRRCRGGARDQAAGGIPGPRAGVEAGGARRTGAAPTTRWPPCA